MFRDALDDTQEAKNELRELPGEIVDYDGTDRLPDEIGLNDDQGNGDLQSDGTENIVNFDGTKEGDEPEGKNGGSYRDVKKTSDGEVYEVHHMPADSASPLERDDGPAIRMEKEDHRQTASCGSSREAREYREEQKELIEQGKFKEALQMDIDDIHDKFGNKYDDAIAEMNDYVDQLEKEGII